MKIVINDKHIVDFINVSVDESVDQIASTFSFTSFFDSSNEIHKEIFKPYSYNKVKIYDSDNVMMVNGVIINNSYDSNSSTSTVTLTLRMNEYTPGGKYKIEIIISKELTIEIEFVKELAHNANILALPYFDYS